MEFNFEFISKTEIIICGIVAILPMVILIILQLIFTIREKKTGKENPLNKEWP